MSRGVVLIVEDEVMLGANLQEYLRRRGWDAHLAGTGAVALQAFAASRPAVVLMDYELPDMTGIDVLKAIRQNDPDCACVIMTARTGDLVIQRAREAQVEHVLQKPFALSDMEQRLASELARERGDTAH
jgi:DNA-binding response OmpR family regulator